MYTSGVPVLIRGLIDTWPVVEKFTDVNLKADHGSNNEQSSHLIFTHLLTHSLINIPFRSHHSARQ